HGEEQLRNGHSAVEAAYRESINPVEVVIGEYDPTRSSEQNRLYWALMTQIERRAADDDGVQHPKEWWHYKLRVELGYADGTIEIKTGGIRVEIPYPKSTTKMGKREFSEYYTKVEAWAAEREIYLEDAA